MKKFNIYYQINNASVELSVCSKKTSTISFDVYRQGKWIASLKKTPTTGYELSSYKLPICTAEIKAISKQIDAQYKKEVAS